MTERTKRRSNGCIEWTGRLHPRPEFIKPRIALEGGKKYALITRYLMALMHQRDLDRSEYACHHCDNEKCVNTDHLYIGSALTNNRDTVARGRRINGFGKTTPKTRFQIYTEFSSGVKNKRTLAQEYEVTEQRINSIIKEYTK